MQKTADQYGPRTKTRNPIQRRSKNRGNQSGVTEMGWDKGGRYYTRSKKVKGRVQREYIGGGEIGRLIAAMDSIEGQERQLKRHKLQKEKAELGRLADLTKSLCASIRQVASAALLSTGYRQHKRGEWRKCRE